MTKGINIRHFSITLLIIVISISIIVLDCFSKVKPINYNDEQIARLYVTPPSDRFSFAVMSDTHSGYTVFNKILTSIDAGHYTFALDIGDIVQYGRKDYFLTFLNRIKKAKTPFLVGIGNHDLDYQKSARAFSNVFGNTYYAFNYGSSLFIVLDDSHMNRIDNTQMIWLEDLLQKKYNHIFVFMHVPPFDPVNGGNQRLSDTLNAQAFMSLMEKYKPEIVFTGHRHGYFDEYKKNVHYVITGGSGEKKWKSKDELHYFNHYIKVDVMGDKIIKNVVHIPVNSSTFSNYSLLTNIMYYLEGNKIFAISTIILLLALFDASVMIIAKFISSFSSHKH